MKDAPPSAAPVMARAPGTARGELSVPVDTAPAESTRERQVDRARAGRHPWARYAEILLMLVQRDLRARSKQAFLGYLWVVIQPLLLTGVFTVLVQRVLGRTDLSTVPYPVFLMAALIPWQFFTNSLTDASDSLVKNVDIVRQVYFPREILAVYPVVARLVDVVISFCALLVMMALYRVPISGWVLTVPLLIVVEMLYVAGLGLLVSAANVVWRDVARALPLVLALLIYAVPVLYTADRFPAGYILVYRLDPIAVLVETFRTAVLGTGPLDFVSVAVLAVVGVVFVAVAQRVFSVFDAVLADVI